MFSRVIQIISYYVTRIKRKRIFSKKKMQNSKQEWRDLEQLDFMGLLWLKQARHRSVEMRTFSHGDLQPFLMTISNLFPWQATGVRGISRLGGPTRAPSNQCYSTTTARFDSFLDGFACDSHSSTCYISIYIYRLQVSNNVLNEWVGFRQAPLHAINKHND